MSGQVESFGHNKQLALLCLALLLILTGVVLLMLSNGNCHLESYHKKNAWDAYESDSTLEVSIKKLPA